MEAVVVENPSQRRFELPIGDDAVAAAYYRVEGDNQVLIHTEVPSEYAGQGAATRLALGALRFDQVLWTEGDSALSVYGEVLREPPKYADVVGG